MTSTTFVAKRSELAGTNRARCSSLVTQLILRISHTKTSRPRLARHTTWGWLFLGGVGILVVPLTAPSSPRSQQHREHLSSAGDSLFVEDCADEPVTRFISNGARLHASKSSLALHHQSSCLWAILLAQSVPRECYL